MGWEFLAVNLAYIPEKYNPYFWISAQKNWILSIYIYNIYQLFQNVFHRSISFTPKNPEEKVEDYTPEV